MKLKDWITTQTGPQVTRRAVLEALAKRSGVSFQTLEPVAGRGTRMGNYQKAKAVSAATDWKVTIFDLCDETPEVTARLTHGA